MSREISRPRTCLTWEKIFGSIFFWASPIFWYFETSFPRRRLVRGRMDSCFSLGFPGPGLRLPFKLDVKCHYQRLSAFNIDGSFFMFLFVWDGFGNVLLLPNLSVQLKCFMSRCFIAGCLFCCFLHVVLVYAVLPVLWFHMLFFHICFNSSCYFVCFCFFLCRLYCCLMCHCIVIVLKATVLVSVDYLSLSYIEQVFTN